MKLFLMFVIIIFSNYSFAIDMNSLPKNSDKSLFLGIPDYQTIEYKRFYISNTTSLTNKPILINSKQVVSDFFENQTDLTMGICSFCELGINFSYIKILSGSKGYIEDFSGLSDTQFEMKLKVFNQFSIVPLFVKTMNDKTITGSQSDGFGLKFVGAFAEDTNLPIYYSVGYIKSMDNKFMDIDQSNKTIASFGTLQKFSKTVILAEEFNILHAKNFDRKEIAIHLSNYFDSFGVRGGFASGFLNKNKENELKLFFGIMTDFDFRNEKIELYK